MTENNNYKKLEKAKMMIREIKVKKKKEKRDYDACWKQWIWWLIFIMQENILRLEDHQENIFVCIELEPL